MTQIVVYGSSDDLIEIEGEHLREEFYFIPRGDDDDRYLAFEDGTVLRIRYTGVWRIEPVIEGDAFDSIVQAPEDDDDNYSDRAYFEDDMEIRWVVLGTDLAKRKP